MKQNYFFSIFLLLLLFTQSCSDKTSQNYLLDEAAIIINIDSVKSDSLKIRNVQYVPLETSTEFLIGYTNKVLIRNNKIYLADFNDAMTLFVYDINGKSLFKIAQRGQGPDEYISFSDFDINTNGEIYIYDSSGKKILKFNSEGQHLQNIGVDHYFDSFCVINDKMYWSNLRDRGNTYALLSVYDVKTNKVDILIKNDAQIRTSGMLSNNSYDFYYSPDSIIYYTPLYSPIIYSIDNDGIHPAIAIKNLNIPSIEVANGWLLEKNIELRIKNIEESGYFRGNAHIYETDSYITFSCVRYYLEGFLLYNKSSKSTFYITFDQHQISLGIGRVKGSAGKDFFGIIEFDSDYKRHKRILETREELRNWKEDDNPVIVFFNFDM